MSRSAGPSATRWKSPNASKSCKGGGPPDLVELTLDLAEKSRQHPRATLAARLHDGTRLEKIRRAGRRAGWRRHRAGETGRDPSRADHHDRCPRQKSGAIKKMDAEVDRPRLRPARRRPRKTRRRDRFRGRLFAGSRKIGERVRSEEPLVRAFTRATKSQSASRCLPLLEKRDCRLRERIAEFVARLLSGASSSALVDAERLRCHALQSAASRLTRAAGRPA